MLKPISFAFEVVETTLCKVKELSQLVRKFILHIKPLWLSMNCCYVFMNMQCWGQRNEKSYRSMFAKIIDWFTVKYQLAKDSFSKKRVIAFFDPSFLKKSGKKTHGLGILYNGTA